jgi:hypothetical protein
VPQSTDSLIAEKGRTDCCHTNTFILFRKDTMMRRAQFTISRPETAPVAQQMRHVDERVARMNDGTMASKIGKLRVMTGQVPNPPIAGESF